MDCALSWLQTSGLVFLSAYSWRWSNFNGQWEPRPYKRPKTMSIPHKPFALIRATVHIVEALFFVYSVVWLNSLIKFSHSGHTGRFKLNLYGPFTDRELQYQNFAAAPYCNTNTVTECEWLSPFDAKEVSSDEDAVFITTRTQLVVQKKQCLRTGPRGCEQFEWQPMKNATQKVHYSAHVEDFQLRALASLDRFKTVFIRSGKRSSFDKASAACTDDEPLAFCRESGVNPVNSTLAEWLEAAGISLDDPSDAGRDRISVTGSITNKTVPYRDQGLVLRVTVHWDNLKHSNIVRWVMAHAGLWTAPTMRYRYRVQRIPFRNAKRKEVHRVVDDNTQIMATQNGVQLEFRHDTSQVGSFCYWHCIRSLSTILVVGRFGQAIITWILLLFYPGVRKMFNDQTTIQADQQLQLNTMVRRMSSIQIKADFEGADADHNGQLDQKEFTKWLKTHNSELMADTSEALFKEADKNGDGVVEFEEMRRFIRTGTISDQSHVRSAPALRLDNTPSNRSVEAGLEPMDVSNRRPAVGVQGYVGEDQATVQHDTAKNLNTPKLRVRKAVDPSPVVFTRQSKRLKKTS